ncbi:DUF676-domain-containing protein [Eremomyces bilateralis CBS 781.70]|uniref:DUF676-domain-containing protein n=1 Tax=Eremomyces bilateralis CBS 781.70 TaxID=1392243 RepID=A0A6G1GB42_9PEZI|nr:DUF676-domain-containing protein [Eremomyces bilateralis CBS 781.70]KAF1815131.1 DUF676-domain-containing protein [Eremomyces bilateralis CBS 781.70]
MGTESPFSAEPDHLCVLVHGLWGNPKHLAYVHDTLRDAFPPSRLHILNCARNVGAFTYDGIELGGERVAHEIEETLAALASEGRPIRKLSVVGYSLGGLVARYAIGLLYHQGWFAEGKLEPINFVTFASPHLGVRTPLKGWHNQVWNVVGARTLSMSGRQLFLIDEFRDTGKPLLEVLAQKEGVFMEALGRFKRRSLYTNILNDRSAVYYTTAITKTDPFVGLHDLNFSYLKGYEPNLIDASKPITLKAEEQSVPLWEWITTRARRAIHAIPLIAFFTLILPLATVFFLLNSGYQTVKSGQRIRLHESGQTGIQTRLYKVPLLVRNVRRAAEEVYENMNSAQAEEYLEEEHATDSQTTRAGHEDGGSGQANGKEKNKVKAPYAEFPTLALTAGQFEMIRALDELGWEKYPVYIHKVHHTHAAIIVRMPKPRFDEGKVVVGHFVGAFDI